MICDELCLDTHYELNHINNTALQEKRERHDEPEFTKLEHNFMSTHKSHQSASCTLKCGNISALLDMAGPWATLATFTMALLY